MGGRQHGRARRCEPPSGPARPETLACADAAISGALLAFKEQAGLAAIEKSGKENLTAAISDEYVEAMKMYAGMSKRADAAGGSAVARHFAAASEDEGEHH